MVMTSLGTGMWELSESNCKAQSEKHLVLGGNLSWQQNFGQIPGGLVDRSTLKEESFLKYLL